MTQSSEDVPQVEPEDDGSWIDTGFLHQILGNEVEILHVDAQRATGKGDNYLSVIFRTRVEYRLATSNKVYVKHIMVKAVPPGDFIQKFINEMNIFRREASIYDEVLPTLYAFADSQLGNDSFKRFSTGFHKTERPGTLVLDDLKQEGFVMASRKDRLDFAHAKLVVHNLAHLHALSIAYSENNPNLISQFEEFVYCEENRERLKQFVPHMLKSITEAVSKWIGFAEIATKLKHLQDTFLDKVIDVCKPFEQFSTVLLHGDCWVNNFLFKYSETGAPIDLQFVDFQLSRKASPALDLQYFFFSSLQCDVRIHRYDDLLQEYWTELARCTKELGYSKPLFTLEDLHQEMERTMFFGLCISMSILPVVLVHPDDTVDMKDVTEEKIDSGEIEMFDKTYERPAFRKTFEQLLTYFDQRGILG